MPSFEHAGATIHYEEKGSGPALLTLAPGGMRSAADLWAKAPFDPRAEFSDLCRVISMDQRNAGASTGPIEADHGWHTYTADQVALLDHLGIEKCAIIGMCIGGPFCLGLMQGVPERITGAVLLQSIGVADNDGLFHEMYDGWMNDVRPQRPEVSGDAWAGLRSNLFDGDFVFNVSREFVRECETPMLVMRGNDPYHPAAVSEELAELAPNAELVAEWKEGAARDAAIERIRRFLSKA
jgi:pimeloyl-ACP methyl ester carboxylesterase